MILVTYAIDKDLLTAGLENNLLTNGPVKTSIIFFGSNGFYDMIQSSGITTAFNLYYTFCTFFLFYL